MIQNAEEREKEVDELRATVDQAKKGAQPGEAINALKGLIELQPYRANSYRADIQQLEDETLGKARDILREATSLAEERNWDEALHKVEEALVENSQLVPAIDLRDQAKEEIRKQIQRHKKMTKIAIAGALILLLFAMRWVIGWRSWLMPISLVVSGMWIGTSGALIVLLQRLENSSNLMWFGSRSRSLVVISSQLHD